MKRAAIKLTGSQVKELLAKAVGGIYVSRNFDVMTDFFNEYKVTDEGLEISVNKVLTAKIPIKDDEYINFAVGYDSSKIPEEDCPYEVWEDSAYFEYKFEISNYMICFNTSSTDKKSLTWEQFRELVANENLIEYNVQNIDGGSVCVDMNKCSIHYNDEDSCFKVCSLYAEMEIDKSIVQAIYNISMEAGNVCYQLEFNNGMSDMTIEPETLSKVF